MLSTFLVFSTLVVILVAVFASAVRRPHRPWLARWYPLDPKDGQDAPPAYLQLWGLIVTLSAIERLATRPEDRAAGPVYLALNFFCVFVLLLLLTWRRHAHAHLCLADTSETNLLHLFAHVVCAVYVRIAAWLLFTGSAS
jgi:hypothetical protein